MPKVKSSISARLNKYVKQHPNELSTDGSVLYCIKCNKNVSADQKSQVEQHLASALHQENIRRNEQNATGRQLFMSQVNNFNQAAFNKGLCEMLVSCDIPIDKVSNENFIKFMETYTNYKIPSQTSLRQNVVNKLYEEKMEDIKKKTSGKFLWGSVDETTDASGRYVANFMIGILCSDPEQSKEKFLLNTAFLEKTNHSTVAKFIMDSLCLLGPDFNKDNLLFLITDAAPYMIKAAKLLKTFFVNMLHMTCIAHGLHRVSEYIRSVFEDVDKLIANCKKIFLKSPSRTNLFREFLPNTPLPPNPVKTRWGTWIKAASYYCTHFDEIKGVLQRFDETENAAIPKAKKLFELPATQQHLAFIQGHFSFLPETITKFENTNVPIVEQLNILEQLSTRFDSIGSQIGHEVKEKFDLVLAKNPGLSQLKKIASVLSGNALDTTDSNFSPLQVASFKFAPLSSVDVERSFSSYKQFYRDNRHNFTIDNIIKHMIILCNKNH